MIWRGDPDAGVPAPVASGLQNPGRLVPSASALYFAAGNQLRSVDLDDGGIFTHATAGAQITALALHALGPVIAANGLVSWVDSDGGLSPIGGNAGDIVEQIAIDGEDLHWISYSQTSVKQSWFRVSDAGVSLEQVLPERRRYFQVFTPAYVYTANDTSIVRRVRDGGADFDSTFFGADSFLLGSKGVAFAKGRAYGFWQPGGGAELIGFSEPPPGAAALLIASDGQRLFLAAMNATTGAQTDTATSFISSVPW